MARAQDGGQCRICSSPWSEGDDHGRMVRRFIRLVCTPIEWKLHSVPLSALPQLMSRIRQDLDASGIPAYTLAHAGDGALPQPLATIIYADFEITGNMHALILYRNEDEEKIAHGLVDQLAQYALALDGTCKSSF